MRKSLAQVVRQLPVGLQKTTLRLADKFLHFSEELLFHVFYIVFVTECNVFKPDIQESAGSKTVAGFCVDIAVPALLKESYLDAQRLQLLCEVVIEGGLLLTQRHIFLLKPLLLPPQRVSRPQQLGGSWRARHHLSKGSSSQVDKGL